MSYTSTVLLETGTTTTAESAEAIHLGGQIDQLRQAPWVADRFESAWIDLIEACDNAGHDGWAGTGSRGVLVSAYRTAEILLRELPPSLPTPEISVFRDGEIEFEWYAGADRVLTVSIGDYDVMHYAAIVGPVRQHAATVFTGSFPVALLRILTTIFRREHP